MDDIKEIQHALGRVLGYAQKNDYSGYNKYDALDSRFLMKMAFGNKYLRLLYSQLIMRSPVNIRPLFRVPKTRNPKGAALFARAYLNLFAVSGQEKDLETAQALLKWLIDNRSKQFEGYCWGYQYPWQDVGFFAHAHLPNRVVTFFVASAFLDAFDLTGDRDYYTVARETLHFMLEAPKILFESDEMKCISYVPDPAINWIVMDVSALVGALAARIASIEHDDQLMHEARRYIHFVVDKQTDYGAWFYSHPAGAHTKMHDNYHTGYILDAILDYSQYSADNSFMKNYHEGLIYYRDNLFLDDGTPKWMNNSVNPIDVHGSAQGIITFLRAAIFDKTYNEFAQKIALWAIKHMQNKKRGFFYYQKYHFFRKPFTIMHWSNGWMARAMSLIIRSHNDHIYKG